MKKKVNLFLLLFVLGLWATLIYKYASRYLYQAEALQMVPSLKMHSAETTAKDTFLMASVARDPFLNHTAATTTTRPVIHHKVSSPVAVKKVPPVVMTAPFPSIEYFGSMEAHKKQITLLKVNNKLMKLGVGESANGLKVVKVCKDSIQVTFQGQARSIKRNSKKA